MVLDSDFLERQASGEAFIKNERYDRVVRQIEDEVVKMLKDIAEDEELYDRVLGEYDEEVKTACLESADLMRTLGPYSRVRIVGGAKMTLAAYQTRLAQRLGRQKDDLLYAFHDPGEEATAQVLSQGTQIPIVNAVFGKDRLLLRRYAEQAGITLSALADLAHEHFKGRPDLVQHYDKVLSALRAIRIEGRLRSFSPKSVPALLTYAQEEARDKDAFRQVLLAAAESGHLSREFVADQLGTGPAKRRVQLYLNADNATIQDLADTNIPEADLSLILKALYNTAFMFNYRSLGDEETDAVFKTTTAVIGRLVEVSTSRSACHKEQRAILATDLVGSTPLQTVLGPEAFSEFLSVYASVLYELADRRKGQFVAFTGDGAFIAFDVDSIENARRYASDMAGVLDDVIDRVSEAVRQDLKTYRSNIPAIRNVISFGNVHVGIFGSHESVVGQPMIEAARILEEKDLFARTVDTLVTGDFRTAARISDQQSEIVRQNLEVRGTGRKISVFRLI
jgi:class 3 adenylate cyclase